MANDKDKPENRGQVRSQEVHERNEVRKETTAPEPAEQPSDTTDE